MNWPRKVKSILPMEPLRCLPKMISALPLSWPLFSPLFWPFYNRELERVGVTLHLAVKEVDAGDILKVVTPDILEDDNYYDITNKVIKKAIHELANVIVEYDEGQCNPIEQKSIDTKVYMKKVVSDMKINDKAQNCS